jgi:hypothetical protein
VTSESRPAHSLQLPNQDVGGVERSQPPKCQDNLFYLLTDTNRSTNKSRGERWTLNSSRSEGSGLVTANQSRLEQVKLLPRGFLQFLTNLSFRLNALQTTSFGGNHPGFVGCPNNTYAIAGWKLRHEFDRLFNVGYLASQTAVASQKSGSIDTVGKERLDRIDFGLWL